MDPEARTKHIERVQKYKPILDYQCQKTQWQEASQKARFRKYVWQVRQKGKGNQENASLSGSQRTEKYVMWAVFLFNSTVLG